MIILFGNSKGGTGKTTLTVMFTQFLINYLLDGQPCSVMLVDADYRQNSIERLRMEDIENLKERAQDFSWNYEFYAIKGMDRDGVRNDGKAFEELGEIIGIYQRKQEEGVKTHLIVDLPGMLTDIVISMVNIADILIIPFEPTKIELNATTDFLNELSNIQRNRKDFMAHQKIFMLPNKLQRGIKYVSSTYVDLTEQESRWREIIPSLTVTPPVVQSAHIKRTYTTAVITPQQAALVSACFSVINFSSRLCDGGP